MTDEKQDLANLSKHPGWLRLKEWVLEQWVTNIDGAITQAATDRDDLLALQKLRQVVAAKRAVMQVLAWPDERLRTLVQAEETRSAPPQLSRRGTL